MIKIQAHISDIQKILLKDNSRFKCMVAGRRTGKTHYSVWELNKTLMTKDNANGIYITSTYTQARKNFFNVYLAKENNDAVFDVPCAPVISARTPPWSGSLCKTLCINLSPSTSGFDDIIMVEI